MKAIITIFVICLFTICQVGKTQTISLDFSGLNNGHAVPLEKIIIENLDKFCDTTLFYPDSSIVLQVMGIDNQIRTPQRLTVFQNSPNPITKTTSIKIFNPATDNLSVVVMEINGKQVYSFSEKLERGYHIFDFFPGKQGTFIFSVSSKGSTESIKLTSSVIKEHGTMDLQYSGKTGNDYSMKEALGGGFVFSSEDHLRYTGYYNSLAKVIEDTPMSNQTYTFEFISAIFSCGQNISINHMTSGGVAPVNKITTYGTVSNIPGSTPKCWITSNLGSDHQASAVSDTNEASAGWYWQFNRKQGYKHDGSTLTPSWTTTSITENSDWQAANDPCNLELGGIWRLPTYYEWDYNTSSWNNWGGPWMSELRLHAAGFLNISFGSLHDRGVSGDYWSNTQQGFGTGWYLWVFNHIFGYTATKDKGYGFSVRCIRNN